MPQNWRRELSPFFGTKIVPNPWLKLLKLPLIPTQVRAQLGPFPTPALGYNPEAHQAQGLRLDPALGLFPVGFGSEMWGGPGPMLRLLLLFHFPWTELSQPFDPSPNLHQRGN